MRFNEIFASAFDAAAAKLSGATVKLRRNALLYSLCALCVVAAIVFAASALILALEPHVGVVYARLILAGGFAVIAAVIVLTLWFIGRPTVVAPMPLHAQAQTAQRSTNFVQLAMIVEAVLLGYSMARRR